MVAPFASSESIGQSRWRRWLMLPFGVPLGVWIGCALLILLISCLIGHAVDAHLLGIPLTSLSPLQLLGLCSLAGAGILLIGRAWYRAGLFPVWMPFPAFLLMAFCSAAFWQAMREYEDQNFLHLEQQIADDVHDDILHSMRDLTQSINRMQARWEVHGGMTPQEWSSDAEKHIHDFPALLAISITNQAGIIQQVNPETPLNTTVIRGYNLNIDPVRAEVFRAVQQTRKPQTTPVIQLLNGKSGFLYMVPLYSHDAFDGVVNAVFDLEPMLKEMIPHYLIDHTLTMHEGEKLVYASVKPELLVDSGWSASTEVMLGNRLTRITLYPNATRIDGRRTLLPSMVLAAGLLISCLLAGLLAAGHRAARKERKVKKAAFALEMYAGELEAARRQAEAASAAKSQFLANMSHEIRTPMHAVLGVAKILQDTPLTQEQKDYLSTIDNSSRHLLFLLNDILDLTKIEAEELVLDHAAFDVRSMFQETVKLLQPLALGKAIALEWDVAPTVPKQLMGDPIRLAQIITNLLGNAIKFTERGSVRVELHYDLARTELVGIVADTGIGIAPAKQTKIFDKFIQGSISISRRYGGSGLGLAITRQLVELMGGSIDFESTEGQGSQFWFRVPAAPVSALSMTTQPKKVAMKTTRIAAAAARLLIAEDHPMNQLIMKRMLERLGFASIDTALNGHEACSMVAKQHYDAIIMDCRMPLMDGYEATAAIREHEQHKADSKPIIIIAMTANALAGDREACLQVGMNDYLSKPLVPEALIGVLEQYFILDQAVDRAESVAVEANQAAPIEWARFNLIAQTPEEAKEILGLFLSNAQEKVELMAFSRRQEEAEQWKAAAHYLKGSAANLGMHVLAEICRSAELAGEAEHEERNQLLHSILQELDRIRMEIAA